MSYPARAEGLGKYGIYLYISRDFNRNIFLKIGFDTVPTLKHGGGSMRFRRGTGQLTAIREIMKSEDYIKILNENLLPSAQNLDPSQRFTLPQTYVYISDCMTSEKDHSSAMAFNESYQKSMSRIENLNKLSVTKKPSGIKTSNH